MLFPPAARLELTRPFQHTSLFPVTCVLIIAVLEGGITHFSSINISKLLGVLTCSHNRKLSLDIFKNDGHRLICIMKSIPLSGPAHPTSGAYSEFPQACIGHTLYHYVSFGFHLGFKTVLCLNSLFCATA